MARQNEYRTRDRSPGRARVFRVASLRENAFKPLHSTRVRPPVCLSESFDSKERPVFSLEDLGWRPFFQQQLKMTDASGAVPARVAEEMKGAYRVLSDAGPLLVSIRGRLLHQAAASDELPAAGDWVLIERPPGEERGLIVRLLERRTKP